VAEHCSARCTWQPPFGDEERRSAGKPISAARPVDALQRAGAALPGPTEASARDRYPPTLDSPAAVRKQSEACPWLCADARSATEITAPTKSGSAGQDCRSRVPDLMVETTIKTGTFCSYTPDPRFQISWEL
jgi:hypothetical protein